MLLQRLIRAFMFSMILGMFGGFGLSILLLKFDVTIAAANSGITMLLVGVVIFITRVFIVGYDDDTDSNQNSTN